MPIWIPLNVYADCGHCFPPLCCGATFGGLRISPESISVTELYMSLRQLIFSQEKWLPWVCCVALLCLFVWPCLLLSFFLLISHLVYTRVPWVSLLDTQIYTMHYADCFIHWQWPLCSTCTWCTQHMHMHMYIHAHGQTGTQLTGACCKW